MWSCGGGCAVVEATAGVARIYSRSGAAGSRKRDTTTRVAGATRPPITGVQSLSRLLTARKVSSSFVYTCSDSGKETSGNETLWCSADGNCWFVMQLACVFAAIYWLTLCKFFSGAWDIVCFHELFFCGVGRVWSPARSVSSVLWLTKGHTGQQRPFTCKFSWTCVIPRTNCFQRFVTDKRTYRTTASLHMQVFLEFCFRLGTIISVLCCLPSSDYCVTVFAFQSGIC